jgi:hypothetical protein
MTLTAAQQSQIRARLMPLFPRLRRATPPER